MLWNLLRGILSGGEYNRSHRSGANRLLSSARAVPALVSFPQGSILIRFPGPHQSLALLRSAAGHETGTHGRPRRSIRPGARGTVARTAPTPGRPDPGTGSGRWSAR